MKYGFCALVLMVASSAQAFEVQLPANARPMVTRDTAQDRYFAPVGPYFEGAVPFQQVDGDVARSSWRIDKAGLTPLQAATPLRTQLEAAGYQIALDCEASACGGYDFRFEIEVLPAPNMYINIRNFHALTALRGSEAITVLASASSGATFVQIIQAGGAPGDSDVAIKPETPQDISASNDSLVDMLSQSGHVILEGLDFESGTSALGVGPFEMLETLAQALVKQPQMRIALVGHTDTVGSLEANISLSRNRAAAVRSRLIETYGIAAERLEAEGIGYLAPTITNETATGREANRRVEAVVLDK